METIPKSTCTKIGFIQKPHGISGELVIRFQEQYYDTLEDTNAVFLDIEGLLVPFFVPDEGIRFRTGESAIMKLIWVETETQAQKLAGLSVFVKNEDVTIDEESFDVRMLEGFVLFDQLKNQIGTISAVNDFSGNIILDVNYLGKEIMIPFNEDFLVDFDLQKKLITLDLPDGLLNLDEE